MSHKTTAFAAMAHSIIDNLEKRNMSGYYFETGAECVRAIMDSIPDGSSIGWGGSETIKEIGLMDAIQNGSYELIDRMNAKNPDEARQIYAKTVLADYYLMSSNALTINGELINIDGNGNRAACLIHGPAHVIIVVGMNKIVTDVESGVARVRNMASPANAIRLNKKLPCAATGHCHDCLSPDCFCNQIVITRRSGHTGRIHVYLVAEDLGY
ncbi:MAG: lactate utilization protein [Bacillus sp. (in: Bacteria)]|nr:lactate utilization protein [Bacillus sp. (in: firmicutes)]MCM1428150.1 lactate utilization protein [Eubacterium sp.]